MTGTGTERTGMREAYEWRGRNVVDQEGAKVGRLEEVYLDQQTGRPEWLLVHTGLLGTKASFAPLAGARVEGEDVRIAYSKQEVKDAPSVEATAAEVQRQLWRDRRSDTRPTPLATP
jgi:sporulation protein YlmC with PRC-barrel domain